MYNINITDQTIYEKIDRVYKEYLNRQNTSHSTKKDPSLQYVIDITISELNLRSKESKTKVINIAKDVNYQSNYGSLLVIHKVLPIRFFKYDKNYQFIDKVTENLFNKLYTTRRVDNIVDFITKNKNKSKFNTVYKMTKEVIEKFKLKYYEDKKLVEYICGREDLIDDGESMPRNEMYKIMDGPLKDPIEYKLFNECYWSEDQYRKKPHYRFKHYLSYNSSFQNIVDCLIIIFSNPNTKLITTGHIAPPNKILYWIILVGLCKIQTKNNNTFNIVIDNRYYNSETILSAEKKIKKEMKMYYI